MPDIVNESGAADAEQALAAAESGGLLTPSRRRLLSTVVGQYGIWGASLLIPLLISPYIARVMGPAGLGLYGFCQAFLGYPTLIIEYGFLMTGARAVAGKNDQQASAVFSRIMGAKALLALVAILMIGPVGVWIPEFRSSPLLLGLIFLGAISGGFHPEWYFRGRERLMIAAWVTVGMKLLTIPAILLWVSSPEHVTRLMAISVAGSGLATLVLLVLSGELPRMVWPAMRSVCDALKDGGWFFLILLSQTATSLFSPILLKSLTSAEQLGLYYVAARIQAPFWGLLSPMISAVFPRVVARIEADPRKGTRFAIRLSLLVVGLACLAAVVIGLLAAPLVHIFAGPKFEGAIPSLRVLSWLIPLVAINTASSNLILMPHRKEVAVLPVSLIATSIVVGMSFWLVPSWGQLGLAWAMIASEGAKAVMQTLSTVFILHRCIGRDGEAPALATHDLNG